jgi:hypothetical protein
VVVCCWVAAEGAYGIRGRAGTTRAGEGGLPLKTLTLIKAPRRGTFLLPTFLVVLQEK